jgi:hypothetical protein
MSDQGGKVDEPQPTTVKPPFDPEQFAKESDSKIRSESEPRIHRDSQPASERPTISPPSPMPIAVAQISDVPVLAIAREDLEWFELSAPARNLLRQVNGRDTVGALASLFHQKPDELLEQLEALAREGLVTWR